MAVQRYYVYKMPSTDSDREYVIMKMTMIQTFCLPLVRAFHGSRCVLYTHCYICTNSRGISKFTLADWNNIFQIIV